MTKNIISRKRNNLFSRMTKNIISSKTKKYYQQDKDRVQSADPLPHFGQGSLHDPPVRTRNNVDNTVRLF